MRELSSDVLVVGGGPAGLSAAVAAARSGARVRLIDEAPQPGGQIWRRDVRSGDGPEARWVREAEQRGVARHPGTTLVESAGHGELYALDDEGPLRLRAPAVVLATGSRELLLPFPGWTLPGVCGAGGLQALVKSGVDIAGARVVVAGTGPLLVAVAATLRKHGARLVALVDQAGAGSMLRFGVALATRPAKLWQGLGYAPSLMGARVALRSWPVRAEGAERLEAVVIRTPSGERRLECDWLACGFGVIPGSEAALLLGCELAGDGVAVDDLQHTNVEGVWAAGMSQAWGSVDLALAEGLVAGHAAAGDDRAARHGARRRARERGFTRALDEAFRLRPELRAVPDEETIVCRCEDVTYGRLKGFADARDAKLKTRCGMGPCQGRVCGAAGRYLFGWSHDRVRPPLIPIPLGALEAIGAARNEGEAR